ncbi:transposase [Streptomyces olivochromogenes]|uniref:Transposase n=1 Tax=Streptomyces olivochromogenes TaxID=1963 RepID=A0A250VR04_STROL|nr:transposase [Streptomyces olivochromogenes]
MRTIGIGGVRLRRRHRTTIADPAAAKAPDLIGRDFTATEVNTKYVGDITYLSIGGGKFCYLATVIDLSRWSSTDLEAVAMAINNRPRKVLGWRTPAEVFEEQLRSLQQPGVATTG